MNVRRMLRIAKEQPWWESYVENTKSSFGSMDKFLKKLDEKSDAEDFFTLPFLWRDTKEGIHFWEDVCTETCNKYYDNSVKVFKKDIVSKPVAKAIDLTMKEFSDILESNKISFSVIETEGKYLVAYELIYKIVEEWI